MITAFGREFETWTDAYEFYVLQSLTFRADHVGEGEEVRARAMVEQENSSSNLGKYPDVEVNINTNTNISLPPKRRIRHPRYHQLYSSRRDADMRLRDSLVYIGSDLYYVNQVLGQDNDLWLCVSRAKDKKLKIRLSSEHLDFRTPDPQYLKMSGPDVFVWRPPLRQQHQGICSTNTFTKKIGSNSSDRARDMFEIISGLEFQDTLPWTETIHNLMVQQRLFSDTRLSENLAVFKKTDNVYVEYKGRKLGQLKENTVVTNEDDAMKPWIIDDARKVNLVLKAGEEK